MKIFVMSDIHGAVRSIERASEIMARSDLILIAGDITRSKSRTEAEELIAAVERCSSRILAVHGNWDRIEVKDFLEGKDYSLHARGEMIGGIGFFGLGGSSPTPMKTATEYSEADMMRFLDRGYETVRNAEKIILLTHCPPQGVRDRTYRGLPGGSRSVRAFLETHRVDLCLCGHIHEAGGIESFHGTVVANGGTFKQGNYLNIEIGENILVKEENLNLRSFPSLISL